MFKFEFKRGFDYMPVKKGQGQMTASFTQDTFLIQAPDTVQFTDTSTGSPHAWLWSFGDGETSTAQNPSHTYAEGLSGRKTVILTISKGGSNTSTTSYVDLWWANDITGGSESDITVGGKAYRLHTFTANDTFEINDVGFDDAFQFLAVGGGGGSGRSSQASGGGGGGYVLEFAGDINPGFVSEGTYTVTVGAGGIARTGTNGNGGAGGLSKIVTPDSLSSGDIVGGGYGGGTNAAGGPGAAAGGGGGASKTTAGTVAGGTSTGSVGTGGTGFGSTTAANRAAGGGGARHLNNGVELSGAVGGAASSSQGGNGADGYLTSFTGTPTRFGAGGGGGADTAATGAGTGGAGGGGNGNKAGSGAAGTANTGGGAGGSGPSADGAAGGSGVVYVRYPLEL